MTRREKKGREEAAQSVTGRVGAGEQAASGRRRFMEIGGTIAAQKSPFAAQGVDIGWAHNGTINVDIAPYAFVGAIPTHKLSAVQWLPGGPPESFDLYACSIAFGESNFDAMIYRPDQGTKHLFGSPPKPPTLCEVLAPFIRGLSYGAVVRLELTPECGGFHWRA